MEDQMLFLPGVPKAAILAALKKAGGNEVASGKLASPESSAALAVNTFGWFIKRPVDLPSFPGLETLDWPANQVTVERQVRFPWRGGRHPWLDAAVETDRHLVGVESKRYEPFRDHKAVKLSEAYDRDVWGIRMAGFTQLRDRLRSGDLRFTYLDATQLVKHAFGLVTEGKRVGKSPVLLYLYAEPAMRGTVRISDVDLARHRVEIETFRTAVSDSAVRFVACTYRDWLARWTDVTRPHADALIKCFEP